MKTKNPIWMIFLIIMLVSIACSFPTASTATPTPTLTAKPVIGIIGGSGGVGGNAGSSGGSGSAGSGSGSSGNSGGNNAAATPIPSPIPTPSNTTAPYTVEQIESLGGESISGLICDVRKPFIVNASSPKVSFTFSFLPTSAEKGTLTYAYNIPSAGESHDAKGTYSISPPGLDGKLLLSMRVNDHVVFKGFDGIIPLRYKFNLVPAQILSCPNNP
jgi:hypothetical protein